MEWTKEQLREHYKNHRYQVLLEIKPLMTFIGLQESIDYDYLIELKENEGKLYLESEILVIKGTKIGCSHNSVSASVCEAFGWAIVNYYAKERSLGKFRTQTLNAIKSYWVNENE